MDDVKHLIVIPTPDIAAYNVLLATTTGNGASRIGIEDSGGKYTKTTVEGALEEIGNGTTLDSRYVNVTGDAMTGDLSITESTSTATNTQINLINTSPTAISPTGINFRQGNGAFDMARIQANPGGFYADSSLNIKVADSSQVLQDRLLIDKDGLVTVGSMKVTNGATGSFTTVDLKTVTVTNGVITSIV